MHLNSDIHPSTGITLVFLLFRIHHQRSRYIYDLFYKRKAISRGQLTYTSSLSFVHKIVVGGIAYSCIYFSLWGSTITLIELPIIIAFIMFQNFMNIV